MALYLGFDSSTQSLTAIVIEVGGSGGRRVAYEHSLRFDEAFPEYSTRNGVLPREDPLIAHSSPLMWAEALDKMMAVLARDSGLDLKQVRSIAGSGQQHGSVYLAASATNALSSLSPDRPIVDQIRGVFTRETAPIWMDSSTSAQCAEITLAMGGAEKLVALTGSSAFERFSGPQIRKYYQECPEGYARTDRIHLVSSYLSSLLAGCHAPIDPGDGAGMNLMHLAGKQWSQQALDATAPGLAEKLPSLAESWTVVGKLAPYWVERYGFPADVKVITWSGDNPCSLVGVGLVKPGCMAISLGTSDTLFGFMESPQVDIHGGGHAFGAPTGHFMSLICFKNGSLAREAVRQKHGLDWDGFSKALRETPPGNRGRILLPWFEPEITPPAHQAGVRRYGGLDPDDAPGNVRAVVEAQMMSTSIHAEWMQAEADTIHATGGAARNRDILRVMADVHGARVYQFEVGNSACLGAALRAFHADELARGHDVSWDEIVAEFAEPVRESRIDPRPENVAMYADLKPIYRACEVHALGKGPDPDAQIEAFHRKYG